jgi:hypothetical protein
MEGRILTQILNGHRVLKQTQALGDCYKPLNASVGRFATDTLRVSSAALASGAAADDSM